MTQEEKQLLLQDLCARLPYGIKVHIKGEYHKHHEVEEIDISDECVRYFENLHLYEEEITNCRLYLRPMSSMTEEESKEYFSICTGSIRGDMIAKIDFYIKHHFDFRLTSEGLSMIEAGLALEVPDGMYNLNEK